MFRLKFFIFNICLLLLSACSTTPVKPAYELLGGNRQSKIYLVCNLWSTESKLIPVENYPKGRLLNIGNEVEILSYSSKEIIFSDLMGTVFTILYNEQRTMMPVENYIRLIFSIKNPLAEIREEYLQQVLKGKIAVGMSKKEVFATAGPPLMTRTPNWQENYTWTYFADRDKYYKVVFKESKVLEIIE